MSMFELLHEIEAYCLARPMAPTVFGREAMNDPSFVNRLREGSECLPRTVRRVRQYIAENPVPKQEAAE